MRESGWAWQTGRVTAVSSVTVTIQFESLEQCRRCLRGEGCGAGVFSRLFSARATELIVPARRELCVGQFVRVGVRETDLMKAALWLYGLPVVAFILAAVLAGMLFDSAAWRDAVGLLSGLLAAAISVGCARHLKGRMLNPALEPVSALSECTGLETPAE
ncbi:MAG: hypothetical protein EA419_00975 [Wenzhouxiangella sp.]|nr:MAG: hypothetical protein EA419_00975 [Wenzhouxiangella sp.]